MIQLVRRASLLAAFSLIASAATAYAECAWVLWTKWALMTKPSPLQSMHSRLATSATRIVERHSIKRFLTCVELRLSGATQCGCASTTPWTGAGEGQMNNTDARLRHPWLRINRVLRVMLHTRWSA